MQKEIIAIFITRVDELLYQVKHCEEYFNAYLALKAASEKYEKEFFYAKDFFCITRQALCDSYMAELIKLYDMHPDAVSIQRIIDYCKGAADFNQVLYRLSPEKRRLLEDEIEKIEDFKNSEPIKNNIDSLITRRDKYYMHRDRKYFANTKKLEEDAPLDFSQTQMLINGAKLFLSRIYGIMTGQMWQPGIHQKIKEREMFPDDLLKLLEMCKQ